jgi:signal transduction histidine kinase
MKLGVVRPTSSEEAGLATRLAWVTGLRLVLLLFLLTAFAFLYLKGALTSYSTSPRIVIVTIGAAFALAATYATLLRSGRDLRRLALIQIVLDQLTWTAIVYVSGGATSGATSFYALEALVGAILIGLPGAALAAGSGVAVYGLLCVAFGFRWILPPADQGAAAYVVTFPELIYAILVNVLGIFVVALLAGYLAERLRVTGGKLEAAQQRALDAERLAVLGRVAAGLAHEIRNPLGSIKGSIEMLREAPGLSAEDRKLCEIVQRETERLASLVNDMMDLAKPRAPKPEAVDVAALARDVVELASRSERSAGGDVRVRYDGPTATAVAMCDGAQMRQVLWNLVRNAVQASAAGTEVTVRVDQKDGRVLLSVDDQGPGIPEDERARIFDAFYTTRSKGAGLGLAVVKRIMDDHAPHGVSFELDSPRRGGASFRIALPRA